ncbi:MAG: hypothetical protein JST81_13620, partial [Bacteroidetes bacterium]|nr:hypothetical protein [Bacteroidota bacterium]
MLTINHKVISFFSTILMLFSFIHATAANDPTWTSRFRGQTDSIHVDSSRTTIDINYYTLGSSIEKTYKIQNVVSVGIDESSPYFIQTDFDVTIGLEITITRADNTDSIVNKSFRLNYKIADSSKNASRVYYSFTNGYKVKMKITSITPAGTINWDYKKVLLIENTLTATRDYLFNCSTSMPLPVITAPSGSITPDELKVHWDDTPNGQTEYDLEWAWIDESAIGNYYVSSTTTFDQEKLFTNNASRVTVSSPEYAIPLFYDGDGRLFIRVRRVQTRETGQRIEGLWSPTAGNAANDMFVFTGHENDLNWQASTTYAEEGKRKSVIQYFDGTLRSRQTVTKDNSTASTGNTGTTVVAETFYDYQGRPAIQVLPAPTLNTIVAYSRNFNQFVGGPGYDKSFYDKLSPGGSICGDPAPALATTDGASRYYSPSNPMQDGFNRFIPDAQGFPYTETRYKADGTGVASQGGVGATHRLGSNHETKYMDEVPSQPELDALFGTDAGINTHYTKNWVKDANGQYSISYVDMQGHTIATALAGSAPVGMDSLKSGNTKTRIKSLLDPTTNIVSGRSIISNSSLVLDKDGPVFFQYAVTPDQLRLLNCKDSTICYDCLYDLIITITPECNNNAVDGSPHIKSNFTLGDYTHNYTCSSHSPIFNDTFTLRLNEGAYVITKELRLSADAQDYLRDSIFIKANTCKTLQGIANHIDSLLVSQANCNITCTACTAALGINEADFIHKLIIKMGLDSLPQDTIGLTASFHTAYLEAKAGCDRICNGDKDDGLGNIRNLHQIMLMDMTPPGGQYARVETPYTGMPFNIFSTTTAPSGSYFTGDPQAPLYLNPMNIGAGGDISVPTNYSSNHIYYDASGNPQLDVNTPVSAVSLPTLQFSNQFRDSWAKSLLPYHPEYHKLVLSETVLAPAYRYEGLINNVDTWSDAVSHNLITNILSQDSFFYSGQPGHDLLPTMALKMSSLFQSTSCGGATLSMWQIAEASVFCRNYPANNTCSSPQFACASSQPVQPSNTHSGSCADWDYVWKAFKTSYLAERKKLIDQYLSDNTPEINNTYIESFNSSSNIVYTLRFPGINAVASNGDLGDLMGQLNSGNYTAATNASQNIAQDQYDSTCKGYATLWFNRLMTCPQISTSMTDTDSAWIINNLRAICKAGSDVDHPLGSSSIHSGATPIHDPTASPWGGEYTDFPSVITRYLENHSISISAVCHPYLIEAPKPYDQQGALVSMPVVTKPEQCQCDLLHRYKSEYQASAAASFSQYLENQYGTYITQGALDTLLRMCDGTYNCQFLPKPILLPPLLQCHGNNNSTPTSPCINCQQYSVIKNRYDSIFSPGRDVPIAIPANNSEVAINHSFEQFANYQTGFQLHWSEYLDFQNACANQGDIPCDSLQYVLNLFYQSPQYLQNPVGSSCRAAFTAFFNNYFHTFYSFDQIMNKFLKQCGAVPTVCSSVITCSEFNTLIGQFYTDYGINIYKNANCASIFTTYFNFRKHTSYNYHQIDSIYNLCGCSLDVCSFPNCFLLTRVYNDFRSYYSNTLWNNPDCQNIFKDYFNNYFGFEKDTYNYGQIEDMFKVCNLKGCGPDPSGLCQPPFSCETLKKLIELYYAHYKKIDITKIVNCKDSFALFFNQQMHTNYTYTQIANIYLKVCKEILSVCEPIYSCEEMTNVITNFKHDIIYTNDSCMIKFTEYFDQYYGVNYNWEKIAELYDKHCRIDLSFCKDAVVITDCYQLEGFLQEFKDAHPDPLAEFGDGCTSIFRELFNAHFGISFSYDQIVNYYEVLCYKYPDVCQSSCDKYRTIIAKMPQAFCNGLVLPQIAASQLYVYLFNQQMRNAGLPELDYQDVINVIKDCSDSSSCALMAIDTTHRNINDPDVLLSLKLAYYIMHPGGLPSDCESDFTSWVNLAMGTGFDYEKLQETYETVLWPGAGNICSASPDPVIVMYDTTGRYSYNGPLLCGNSNPVFTDPPLVTDLCSDIINTALGFADEQYEYYLDSLRNVFDTAYHNKCLSIGNYETFSATYSTSEYHYTLYYYDQAGNLVKTIPPEGVHPKYDATWINVTVPNARNNGTVAVPAHTMATQYRYNTLNQVIAQITPDAGLSAFWYDRLGRLVISQNEKQAELVNGIRYYSYTIYDQLGRIAEVGEKPKASASPLMTQTISQNEGQLQGWIASASNLEKKRQITRTVYDDAWEPFCDNNDPANNILCQKNLRNRVSYTFVKNTDDNTDPSYVWDAATFYSYDIHGNVDTLLQDYKTGMGAINCGEDNPSGNRWKKMVYNYDLISGKVNEVAYQPGKTDQFYHRYEYDAENRLTHVKTSTDYIYWENDASYSYYKHGPLARTVLGETQVQGIDYAYTLQGWLKGVNGTAVGDGTYDIGNDGKNGSVNSLVARDAYGFSLNYFSGDYIQINTTLAAAGAVSNNLPNTTDNVHTGSDLFNGNIRAMLVNIPKLGAAQLYGYRYDQLNRIVAMNSYAGVSTSSNTIINPATASQDYNERISYDANGNILGYLRNGAAAVNGLAMDSLTYKYDYYAAGNVKKTYIPGGAVPTDAVRLTNRLNYVKDNAGGSYTEDIKDENPNNYTYDKIGNLTSDIKENIDIIEWTVYGKISHIHKTTGMDINYTYDASGNRISKTVTVSGVSKVTYYVRDASGNVMSIYQSGETAVNGGDLSQTEIHLYGSSRIGIYNVNNDVQCISTSEEITTFIRGNKFFELSNHLGNVLVTVNDRKIPIQSTSNTTFIDHYEAEVITANDYYPFGMGMVGRVYQAG